MIRKTLLLLFMLLLLLPCYPATAAAGIKITDSTTGIIFPDLLTFSISAESPSAINRIRLRYEVDKITYAPAYAEAWPNFNPSTKVEASWNWDMRKGSLPPGAKITYWWIVEDRSGNRLTGQKKTFSFDDTRYKWQKIGDSKISIFWYRGSQSFADELLKATQEAALKLGKDTGVYLDKTVSFYIYGNYTDLRGSIVAPEDWTGGVAYAGFNIISIGISPNNLEWGKKAVAHELGHLITHQVTTSPYGATIPPWLDEGLAMHAEGEQSLADSNTLVKAIETGAIATLRSLSSPFPADAQETSYAYAQSQSIVEYLINSHGKDKLNRLLVLLNDGNSMDKALYTVYGFNMAGLEDAWTKYMLDGKGQTAPTVRLPDRQPAFPTVSTALRALPLLAGSY